MEFEAVIGLEVHAQLLTDSKIFCGCSTAFGAEPNHHTCPVCTGMPGTLPVINKKVVEFAIRAGLALGCEIRRTSVWARKNYFYPDLPKGYQISQFELPICEHGRLTIDASGGGEKTVRVRRIHMEEDAGKNIHDGGEGVSLVDFNRAGVPLVEIVGEPDISTADEASDYLKGLRDVLMYLGVNDGNMEEGSLRCDANVSIRPKGAKELGNRTELKNMNSFRFVRQAIDHEVKRQIEVVKAGGRIAVETRLWDQEKNETRVMRTKEEAHDYRYFPEPDLLPLTVSEADIEAQRKLLPELPRPRVTRYVSQYGIKAEDAKTLVANRPLADFFELCLRHYKDAKKLANWLLGDFARALNAGEAQLGALKFGAEDLGALLALVDAGTVSGTAAKEVFAEMVKSGAKPADIVKTKGLAQVSDAAAIEAVVDEVLAKSAGEVEKYRAGKTTLLGFFTGQVMKAMKGKGNPGVINDLLKKKLGG